VTLDFSKLVQPGERPLAAYERLAASGVLRRDDAQRSAIAVLDRLHRTLETNRGGEETPPPPPSPKREGSWFADLFGGPPPRESSAARRDQNQPHAGGVYLHGGPGCGKTFCMDLAYACLPGAPGVGKRREHFHSFMLETHVKLHELGKLSKGAGTRDTVATYAREVARDARVLCLDEFQVTDVADAMIIRRLLDQLWARGVTLVTTSNRAPTDLYKNGLNRPQFVPCIEAIEARCDVHEMRSDVDYRLTGHALVGAEDDDEEEDDVETKTSRRSSSSVDRRTTWKVIDSSDPEAHAKADAWLSRRCERLAKGEKMVRVEVALGGRRVDVAKAGGGVAHLQFDDVCASALGAGDYTALASVFHTVGLGGVPRMTTERADLMRRFITFVDVMYEHKVKLIATAPCAPRDLFDEGSRGGGRGGRGRVEGGRGVGGFFIRGGRRF
jgi:predicted ATPase